MSIVTIWSVFPNPVTNDEAIQRPGNIWMVNLTKFLDMGIYLGYTAKVKAASSKKEAKGGLLKK